MSSERGAWLKGLRVGDEVAIKEGRNFKWVARIERITPTRQIVSGHWRFNSEGYERGNGAYSHYWIAPIDEEIRATLEHREISDRFRFRMEWGKIPLTKLREIDAILKRDDSGKAEETGGAEQ